MFLLDTNTISELRKVGAGKADPRVARWVQGVAPTELHVSAITLEELEIGVLRMERRDAAQGAVLRHWLAQQVLPAFDGRILPVDAPVVRLSARMHVPNPQPTRDAYIAATALVHGLTVVSRNVADFAACGASVLNPWEWPV
ncbi:type II toxin-antitoxin system VapC family toxin [Ottowia testudinis]|uniref:Ribonuclease VapC n=1 Tax=Ottowia testudinis TaxID=2816950 RepID=A0A975CGV3_9BURK|nr:type II toxin-antitoxin system VapC family toxin [Ottowia testudinis]QTD44662.1 type II toxin-antitoxin system VapC family toxin [Ottowia testudinis]